MSRLTGRVLNLGRRCFLDGRFQQPSTIVSAPNSLAMFLNDRRALLYPITDVREITLTLPGRWGQPAGGLNHREEPSAAARSITRSPTFRPIASPASMSLRK